MDFEGELKKHNHKRSFRQENTYFAVGNEPFIALNWGGHSKFYEYASLNIEGRSEGNAFINPSSKAHLDVLIIQTPDEICELNAAAGNDLDAFHVDLILKIAEHI